MAFPSGQKEGFQEEGKNKKTLRLFMYFFQQKTHIQLSFRVHCLLQGVLDLRKNKWQKNKVVITCLLLTFFCNYLSYSQLKSTHKMRSRSQIVIVQIDLNRKLSNAFIIA